MKKILLIGLFLMCLLVLPASVAQVQAQSTSYYPPWRSCSETATTKTVPSGTTKADASARAGSKDVFLYAYSVAWIGGAGALACVRQGAEYVAPISGVYRVEYEYAVNGRTSMYGISPGAIVDIVRQAFLSALIKLIGGELAEAVGVRNAGIQARLLFAFGATNRVDQICSKEKWTGLITWQDESINRRVVGSFTTYLQRGTTYYYSAILTAWTINSAAAVQASGCLIQLSGGLLRVSISPPSQSFSLTVSVRDSKTGGAVAGASVYLDGSYKGTTGSDGRLIINNVSEGSHTVRVSKSGYYDKSQTVAVSSNISVTISLTRR